MKYTICTGNLTNGFKLYGTFDSQDAAMLWAIADAYLPDGWHVITIHPVPEKETA